MAKGLSPLRESPPPGEDAAWASVMAAGGGGGAAGGAPGLQHTQRSSSVDASALRGHLQTLKVPSISHEDLHVSERKWTIRTSRCAFTTDDRVLRTARMRDRHGQIESRAAMLASGRRGRLTPRGCIIVLII